MSILFEKIEDEKIKPEIERLQHIEKNLVAESPAALLSIEEFSKIELRVARVVSAERIPKSNKLLKLIIEIDGHERQIIAGIAQHYQPEELVNRRIIVVANLKPALIRGLESTGMLLAAESETGDLSLLTLDRDLPTGSRVR